MKYLYGIQPTGRIHIGNYLGGLRLAIEKKADILIAQYHAMTTKGEVDEFYGSLSRIGAWGAHEQSEDALLLAWKIQCKTPMSDLKKMTQFKEKGETNIGLFTYPCLMAADIILADPDYVIIGEDQLQHMEFYRKTCKRLGIKHIAENLLTETPRIMSIKDPTKKMSKSLGDEHCIYLGEDCTKKIMKAPTTPEGIKNLQQIASALDVPFSENYKEFNESLIKAINSISTFLDKHPNQ
jgi:tryptophanyl-tRNA synthetase